MTTVRTAAMLGLFCLCFASAAEAICPVNTVCMTYQMDLEIGRAHV